VTAFAVAYGAKFPRRSPRSPTTKTSCWPSTRRRALDSPARDQPESTFATVRLRTKVTKGHGSKAAAVAMAFKLIESAQRRWQMVNAPHLVALVRAGATLVNGELVERSGDQSPSPAEPAPPTGEEDVAEAA
jgi:hypothetical protein